MDDGANGRRVARCDIAIVGSAIASSLLSTILAKRGLDVIVLEKDAHPQFAIGESTIPQTSLMLKALSQRYDIPEFDRLSSFEDASRTVARTCGKKSNFGFVFQRPGQPHALHECHQLGVARTNFSESHFYRQDIDSFLLQTTIRYGAKVHQRTAIKEIAFDDLGVTITTDKNFDVRARCIVDGSGYVSFLARKLGVREDPPNVRTQSRTIFTHMIDVRPFDECVMSDESGLPKLAPWHGGTLHHIFREGWMWVIPFNNHPDHVNPVVSVGMQLDPRTCPKPADKDPFDEFREFIAPYPEIVRQFEHAKPIREWVSSGRLQYSSSKAAGNRWCMLSHSSGFVDPLFSRGLSNTVEVVSLMAETLLQAHRDDDFSEERLRPLDTLQRTTVDWNDRLVHGAYISFRDFRLWNAWFRIWGLTQVYGVMRLAQAFLAYEASGDRSAYDLLDKPLLPGALTPNHPRVAALIQSAHGIIEGVESGQTEPGDAAEAIFDLFRAADFLPPNFAFTDPDARFGRQGLMAQLEMDHWFYDKLRAA
jgi:tetracycline 7-halogenase / FADH2 O2-dependent halogenase